MQSPHLTPILALILLAFSIYIPNVTATANLTHVDFTQTCSGLPNLWHATMQWVLTFSGLGKGSTDYFFSSCDTNGTFSSNGTMPGRQPVVTWKITLQIFDQNNNLAATNSLSGTGKQATSTLTYAGVTETATMRNYFT